MVSIKSGEVGTPKGDNKQISLDAVCSMLENTLFKGLVKELLSGFIAEEITRESIALYPGKFKPPHKGHFEVAKQLLKKVDRVEIIIPPKEVEGITAEKSTDSMLENTQTSLPTTLKDAMLSLTTYMIENDMNILPLPKIKIIDNDSENANSIFGSTAYYNPNDCSVTLYTLNRHPKDILRSYAHEMIHRIQDNEGRLKNVATTNTNEDGDLLELEKEAYLNGNITFRNWEDSLKNPKPVKEVYFLDSEKYNYPKTFVDKLRESLHEITLSKDNAVDVKGDLMGGEFYVGDKIYIYTIKNIPNPYNDLGVFYNVQFTPQEKNISKPTKDTNPKDYIKILSTMYKIIVDFVEKEKPKYIGIASMDNIGDKNYHTLYANLTDNKFNRIPGYFRKDVNLEFNTPQGKGRFVVLKRTDV
jgi:cytidyltransferase-like protein